MVTVSMYNILEHGEKTDDTVITVLKEQENEFCHFCLLALSPYRICRSETSSETGQETMWDCLKLKEKRQLMGDLV